MRILIDNDKLIHLSWKLRANAARVDLKTFFSIDEFLDSCNVLPLGSSIYIDSDLDNGIKGEIESERLFKRGFTNLWIATGYSDLETSNYPWIKGVISKQPPF